jgi:phenylalanyl-tRNA synthetase beta chain
MKLPLSWIKDIIDINIPPHQIAKILTLAGLEVDAVNFIKPGFEKVVVGHVLEVKKHPDAEKLCIATVSDGKESFQVVCGAANCRAGMKTAYATVGATLTDNEGKPFKLKKAKLRGVESNGMLCAWDELGLGGSPDGIIEFDEHLIVGADVAEMYSDVVFEIALTPNLNHCSSALGVARELAAATGLPLKHPAIHFLENKDDSINSAVSVKILDKVRCPRYACRVIKGVTIGPSPDWLQKRLEACDLRPVNNIVDVTNLVLFEFGHPLHAFDLDELAGSEIIVRTATAGEKFITLDDKERILHPEDLVICDKEKPVALGGVMGGKNSEVKDSTRNILLESAYFLPTAIRRTSKRLGLQSEGSKRFERGADPNNVLKALDRAIMLMQELAGGKVCEGFIDIKEGEFLKKEIQCRFSRINALLGTLLSVSEVEDCFSRLEMKVKWDGQDTFHVTVPTYRGDVLGEIDLVEEVARIYGYENIPKKAPKYSTSLIPNSPIYDFEKEIRSRLLGEGLQELMTCDLIGPSLLKIVHETILPEEMTVKVLNPTSIEQSILRTSLLPGLLQAVKFNFDHQNYNLSGFEIGNIHFKESERYREPSVLGMVLTGEGRPQHWDRKPHPVDFYDLKGMIESLFSELGIQNIIFQKTKHTFFHSGRQASISIGAVNLGSLGEVHPSIMRRLDVNQRIYFAEIDLEQLLNLRLKTQQYKEIAVYPCSERDLTMTLADEIPIDEIFQIIYKGSYKYLEKASLKDVYKSEKIGKENKNVTFRFVYRDNKKTIAQEAVDAEHARIVSELNSRFSGR